MPVTLLIAAKDTRQRLRDRSLFLYALVVPLGLAFVFSLILGDVDDGDEVFRYAVVDQDRGPVAAAFTDQFLPSVAAGGAIAVQPAATVEEGRRLVEDGDAAAAFVIPAGFSDAASSGAPVTIEVIGDVDAPLGVQVAQALAGSYAADLTAVRLSIATAGGGDPARAAETPSPVSLAEVAADRRELDLTTYFSAGMAVFFLFFSVQFGVSSLLEERQNGTMARLLAAPISRTAVLGGKLLVSFAVGMASLASLAYATSGLLGARWGDSLGVAVLVVTGVAAATGIMALVGSLARSADQAATWQAMVAVVLGVLGGAFFPVSQVGGVLAWLSYITPHRWFLQGLADLAGGDGLEVVWAPAAAMLGFAVVTGGIALLRIGSLVRP